MFDFTKDSGLPPALAARMQRTVEAREAAGFNVHFINERGARDRFSFRDQERADAFKAKLQRQGLTVLNDGGL